MQRNMMTAFYQSKVKLKTGSKTEFVDITHHIQQFVADSGVRAGLCCILHTHTTAGIILNSTAGPKTRLDLKDEIDRLVPTRVDFHHQFDTPRDAAAHIKAMLVGHSVLLPIEDGKLAVGPFMGVLFCEFDGPRDRTVTVQIWADASASG